jgi:Na+/H+-dicarboxylate symporter
MLVMWFAPFAVFAAVAAAIAKSGPGIFETYAFFMAEFYLGIVILWALLFVAAFAVLGGRAQPCSRPCANRPAGVRHGISEAAYPKTLAQLEKFGCSNRVAVVRAAARLLVQPRRLDDVLHLRGDVHRPGLRHRTESPRSR